MIPTTTGYYWLRWYYLHRMTKELVCGGTEVVRVFARPSEPTQLFYQTFAGGNVFTTPLSEASANHQWSGPIVCPFPP